MKILPDPFLSFFFLIIILNLWIFYDYYRFTRFEGSLKRGLMIRTDPLSWEARQFLDSLSSSLKVDRSFIRKENHEVLIVEKLSSQTHFFFQRRGLFPYTAYINLNAPESQIEFRTSFLTFPILVIVLIFFFVFFADLFSRSFPTASPAFWILLIVFLVGFVASFLFELYQARRRLLKFLEQVMSQQRSGSDISF